MPTPPCITPVKPFSVNVSEEDRVSSVSSIVLRMLDNAACVAEIVISVTLIRSLS